MKLTQKNRNQCRDTERKGEMLMSESEKKALSNEELEDVNGGTIIDDVMDTMDVMEEMGAGLDMSVGASFGEGACYIKNLETGQLTGPFSNNEAHKRVKVLKGMGGKFKVVYKKKS